MGINNDMKRITLSRRTSPVHIEAPGCIVNIYPDLVDSEGREVVTVEILADGDRYSGDPHWWIDGKPGASTLNVRVVRVED